MKPPKKNQNPAVAQMKTEARIKTAMNTSFVSGTQYATIIAKAVFVMLLDDYDVFKNPVFNALFNESIINRFNDIMKDINDPRLPVIEKIEEIIKDSKCSIDISKIATYIPELNGYMDK